MPRWRRVECTPMLFFALVLAAVGMRFLPHLPNFTPVGAILLFCGAWMARKRLWFPVLLLIASDFVLRGFVQHYGPTLDQYFTWGGYLIYVALGLSLRQRVKAGRVIGTTVAGSAAFFAISNFGVWAAGILYPHTWAGLVACYVAAVPFAWGTFAGDLFYAGVFFGVYAWLLHRREARTAATA